MDYIDFTRQKTELVLKQIERLSESDFPHTDAKEALELLKNLFESDLSKIQIVEGGGNEVLKIQACAGANSHIARFHPILGFCLRSTNVRNAFELYLPLLQISRQLISRDTKLVLSSEWEFSPFTYPLVFPELPNFVLIGLPASESGNGLIIPLTGHELGHSVWRAYNLEPRVEVSLKTSIIAEMRKRWSEFQTKFQYKQDVVHVETDMFVRNTWLQSLTLSLRQSQEMFCDIVGVRSFGESYFFATEYFLSPTFGNKRSAYYPDIKMRTDAMVRAAQRFGYPSPDNYTSRFSENMPSLEPKQAFILALADAAVQETVEDIISLVERIAANKALLFPDKSESQRIYQCFKEGVPASNCRSLPDIINAGWLAYLDDDLWENLRTPSGRFAPLNELILKTIEVLEFEIRMGA